MLYENFVNKLIELNYTVSCAESCTGGLVAASIVSVANASKVFNESFVTYANEAKIKYLAVKDSTIEKHGVVSEEVTKEMAIGLRNQTNANVCLTISGIAGPSGGTPTKPVGMVCFGIGINDKVYTNTSYFGNIGRNEVRRKSVDFVISKALELLIKL